MKWWKQNWYIELNWKLIWIENDQSMPSGLQMWVVLQSLLAPHAAEQICVCFSISCAMCKFFFGPNWQGFKHFIIGVCKHHLPIAFFEVGNTAIDGTGPQWYCKLLLQHPSGFTCQLQGSSARKYYYFLKLMDGSTTGGWGWKRMCKFCREARVCTRCLFSSIVCYTSISNKTP